MANLNNKNLKLAIQKQGRLTDETIYFLRRSGLEFESYKQRLFSTCRNFPLEIFYVRDNDIPDYVASGTVDLGIVGDNTINEKNPKVRRTLDLDYGFCSLVIAVPKESEIKSITDLKSKTIATSYPNSVKEFFDKKSISTKIINISGSVEIAPSLGVADSIADLTSTGSTIALNDLRIIEKIYESSAVLIANSKSFSNGKSDLLKKLIIRFEAVLAAKNYKYVMMNARSELLPVIEKFIPGLKSPTVSTLSKPGYISIQTVIKESIFWETIEKLKKIGASEIIVLPIEKMII